MFYPSFFIWNLCIHILCRARKIVTLKNNRIQSIRNNIELYHQQNPDHLFNHLCCLNQIIIKLNLMSFSNGTCPQCFNCLHNFIKLKDLSRDMWQKQELYKTVVQHFPLKATFDINRTQHNVYVDIQLTSYDKLHFGWRNENDWGTID